MTQEEINTEVMLAIIRLTEIVTANTSAIEDINEPLSCREVRGKHSGLRIVVTNPATAGGE